MDGAIVLSSDLKKILFANAQLIPSLISGKIKYALVPEPFTTVAMKTDGKIKKVIDIQDEFFYTTNIENYPMSVIVVNKRNRKYCEKNIKKKAIFSLDLYQSKMV
jgi:NitT/TauT family transport system substrate-binding protein